MADSTVRPSPINIAEDELDDLARRLAATRWPSVQTAKCWECSMLHRQEGPPRN